MTCCRCNQIADAWMIFDYDTGHIEIFSMPEICDGYGGYPMCEPHANRLRPPVGWGLTDSRESALTLFPLSSVSRRVDSRLTVTSSDVA